MKTVEKKLSRVISNSNTFNLYSDTDAIFLSDSSKFLNTINFLNELGKPSNY